MKNSTGERLGEDATLFKEFLADVEMILKKLRSDQRDILSTLRRSIEEKEVKKMKKRCEGL